MELLDLDGLERLAQKSPWIDHVIVLDLIQRLRQLQRVREAAERMVNDDGIPEYLFPAPLRAALAALETA